MASLRTMLALALVVLVALFSSTDARPRFNGLVSLDFSSLEQQGYSSKGSRGCQVVSNALDAQSGEFSEEELAMQLLKCDWE